MTAPTSAAGPVTARPTARGTVFNIQRFSTTDGPGVRTTVFLKGCSNACAWCHNPESLRRGPELRLFLDRCIGCGRCVDVCPNQAQYLDRGERRYERERCRACGACAGECFAGALELAGREMSVEAVLAEVRKDESYYRHSGGGVTFSGGEPVLQADFLRPLLAACRDQGIHTALDTAGNYPWHMLEGLLPHVDLVLYDLKACDPDLHRRVVGTDAATIRRNLERLGRSGRPFAVRTPVVGGVNDTESEIGGIARLIGAYPSLAFYELLPYHPLGEAKLESLGREPRHAFTTPSRDRLKALADVARAWVTDVRP